MKAAIYARAAVRKQSPHHEGIDLQIEICMKYANEKEFQVTDVFTDVGYSGMDLDRPGLHKMRKQIARQSMNAVVVLDVARLTRLADDMACLERELAAHRVELCVVEPKG